jgi:hypothetical protein
VISPTSDDFDARVTELERYIDELDRRTYSTLAVTNSATGVKNLEIGPDGTEYIIRLRDDHNNIIFSNRPDIGVAGFRMPLPMYPGTPFANFFSSDATWLTTWQATLFVNSPILQCAYRFEDPEQGGGTVECRMLYDIGGGQVVIADSTSSAANPVNALKQFQLTWPSNVFDIDVSLYLQCRVSVPGAFDTFAIASPVYILGG